MPSYQHSVAARTKALCFAEKSVTNRIIGGVVDGSMVYFSERETLAWILDPAQDHLSRAHISDFDVLAGIEITSMFDGIEQHLTEGGCDVVSFGVRKIRHLVEELHQSISCFEIAAGNDAHPFRCGRDKFDAIIPRGFRH